MVRRQVNGGVRCACSSPRTAVIIFILFRVLHIVFHPVRCTGIGSPARSIGGVSGRHCLSWAAVRICKGHAVFPAAEEIAAQIHFRFINGCPVLHITVNHIWKAAVIFIAIGKGERIFLPVKVNFNHRRTIGGNLLIDGRFPFVVSKAGGGGCIWHRIAVGGSCELLRLRQGIAAVQFLPVVFRLIGRIAARGPLGVYSSAVFRHGGGKRIRLFTARGICIPSRKSIAFLDRILRGSNLGTRHSRKRVHYAATVGIKGNVLGIFRISPFNGYGQTDRLGGKGQRTALPDDGHLACLIYTAVRFYLYGVLCRIVSELRVG